MTQLSVIIPAFNEGKRLEKTLNRINDFLSKNGYDYEVIVVDDGSVDNTADLVKRNVHGVSGRVYLLSNEKNMGKGFSLRRGMAAAKGEMILFTDADLSTPIEEISKLEAAVKGGADIAIGSRSMRGSEVKVAQPFYRVLSGKIFNFLVQSIVMRGIIDTQCGFKLLKKNCAGELLPYLLVNGFSFDVELLYMARKKAFKIKEAPVVWINCRESKVKLISDSFRMFLELWEIRRLHSGK